jgi:hypothetical protein
MNDTPNTMRRRLASEDGWAVVTALLLLTAMLASSIALAAFVDNQTQQSGATRNRETAFNMGEAALNAQVVALTRNWSYVPTLPLPSCGAGLAAAKSCPADASLRALFPTSDATGATWHTDIRDNAAPYTSFYSDALLGAGYAAYDANHDDRVWVRATAMARGRTRTLVALVRAQQEQEDVVHSALVTGSLDLRNSGNKVVIDAGSGGTVDVTCTPQPGESTPCLGYAWKSSQSSSQFLAQVGQQIQPNNVTTGYSGGLGLSQEALDRLKMTAWANGTYYDASTGCPTSLDGVVWIAGLQCSDFTGNTDINAPPKQPGFLIVDSGTLRFRGTGTYYGVLIHLNTTASTGILIDLNGDTCIKGAVLVDGPGTTTVGSSGNGCPGGGNISYDPSAFGAVKSIATAGIVQNSWRELRSH